MDFVFIQLIYLLIGICCGLAIYVDYVETHKKEDKLAMIAFLLAGVAIWIPLTIFALFKTLFKYSK